MVLKVGKKSENFDPCVGKRTRKSMEKIYEISGTDPVGGPEGPWPPQLEQNAPDFGPNAIQIWAKCPHLHQSAPQIWAKCPPKCPGFVQERPQMHHLGDKFSKFSGGGPPDPPNIVFRLRIIHSNANWATQHPWVICPLISLAPPAPSFWISP